MPAVSSSKVKVKNVYAADPEIRFTLYTEPDVVGAPGEPFDCLVQIDMMIRFINMNHIQIGEDRHSSLQIKQKVVKNEETIILPFGDGYWPINERDSIECEFTVTLDNGTPFTINENALAVTTEDLWTLHHPWSPSPLQALIKAVMRFFK